MQSGCKTQRKSKEKKWYIKRWKCCYVIKVVTFSLAHLWNSFDMLGMLDTETRSPRWIVNFVERRGVEEAERVPWPGFAILSGFNYWLAYSFTIFDSYVSENYANVSNWNSAQIELNALHLQGDSLSSLRASKVFHHVNVFQLKLK